MLARTLSAAAVIGLLASAAPAYAQYAAQRATGLWNETAPQNGSHGELVSPNSEPPGFTNGTDYGLHAQTVARWFAGQGYQGPQPPSY